MADREKVMLEIEKAINEADSTAAFALILTHTLRDALALLKEQEARVMTLEEVINAKDKTDVWLDELDCVVVSATISNWVESKIHDVTFFYGIEHTASGTRDYMNNNYNKTWRCWTSRPTEEQRKAAKWE